MRVRRTATSSRIRAGLATRGADKSLASDGTTVGQGYQRQGPTVAKSRPADRGEAGGQGDREKGATVAKGIRADGGEAVRQGDRDKGAAAEKG